ncbi:MAG: PEP-CTERM sorting domain-containing protein [Terriglobales bacterium]
MVLTALLLCAASVASANPIDPQIIIRNNPANTIFLTSPNFTLDFTAQIAAGNCQNTFNINLNLASITCTFANISGVDFINLMFTIPFSQGPLSGAGDIFGQAQIFNDTQVVFFAGNIPNISDFEAEFVGFTNTTVPFQITANVPEPATMGLFLTGVGALIARRRLRRQPDATS